jgi:predicted dehydrogenase
MAEQVRIGVIGTSWWTDLLYLPMLHDYPRAAVTAICGRNRERANEMAQKYGIPQVFTDYRAMIESGGLDAVIVSTPDDVHHAMVMAALDASLHVLCEKPLALNVADARAMYEKAEAVGVKHMTFYTWRWTPLQQYMKELVEDGYIGRCYDVQLAFRGGFGRGGEYAWRYDRQRCNGVWADLGSHMIDLARWYVGEIAAVSAHVASHIQRPGPDGGVLDPANDSAVAAFRFQNGAHGSLHASSVTHIGHRGVEQYITLYGEAGTLEGYFDAAGMALAGARANEDEIKPLPIPDHIWGDIDRSNPMNVFQKSTTGGRLFVDAILDDKPSSPTFYDGLKAQEVINAGIESYNTGRWIELESSV